MVPDLAEAMPEVSEDGKTVTVKIRKGVKFSPPVDREVTSKDVKYAMERMFFSTVATGYSFYFEDIVGAEAGAKPGTKIEGIETPDDQTIVFQLSQGDRRRARLRRARRSWPPRRSRRSTRRSSTRRRRRPTARTRSRRART